MPSGGTMSPPPDGSTSYPSGGTSYPSHEGSSYTQPAGGSYPSHEGSSYTQPAGNTYTQPSGDGKIQWDGQTFQKDGAGFQKDGKDYQQHGAGYQFRFEGGEKPGKDWSEGKETEMRQRWEKAGKGGERDVGVGRGQHMDGMDEGQAKAKFREHFGQDMPENEEGRRSFFQKTEGGHGSAARASKPSLPDLSNLEELAAEEEEVDLSEKQYKALEKLVTNFAKSEQKIEKGTDKALDKAEDGVSNKEEKAIVKLGTSAEGLAQKIEATLEQLEPYADSVDSERFAAILEKCEAILGDVNAHIDNLAEVLGG